MQNLIGIFACDLMKEEIIVLILILSWEILGSPTFFAKDFKSELALLSTLGWMSGPQH